MVGMEEGVATEQTQMVAQEEAEEEEVQAGGSVSMHTISLSLEPLMQAGGMGEMEEMEEMVLRVMMEGAEEVPAEEVGVAE